MPGRGTPWRGVGKGKQDRIGSGEIEDESITSADILDGTIQEGDLDTALQSKVNQAGGHVIEDEGSPLSQRPNMNFIGAGVTASDDGETTNVTIPGGAGGGGWIASRKYLAVTFLQTVYDPMLTDENADSELTARGGPMPKAGKVQSIKVNVRTAHATQSSNSLVTVRKNGATLLQLSFDSTTTGIKTQAGPQSFATDDLLDVTIDGNGATGTSDFTLVIEYSFD